MASRTLVSLIDTVLGPPLQPSPGSVLQHRIPPSSAYHRIPSIVKIACPRHGAVLSRHLATVKTLHSFDLGCNFGPVHPSRGFYTGAFPTDAPRTTPRRNAAQYYSVAEYSTGATQEYYNNSPVIRIGQASFISHATSSRHVLTVSLTDYLSCLTLLFLPSSLTMHVQSRLFCSWSQRYDISRTAGVS